MKFSTAYRISITLAIVMMTTLGCATFVSVQPGKAILASPVDFLDRSRLGFPIGIEESAAKDNVSLDITGISALNKDIAFVYGLSSVGSVLLRSEAAAEYIYTWITVDGGRTWKQGDRRFVSLQEIKKQSQPIFDRATGQDGSQWECDADTDPERIIIKRKLQSNPSSTTIALQRYWAYKHEKIVPR
jgi:hypothetical protein